MKCSPLSLAIRPFMLEYFLEWIVTVVQTIVDSCLVRGEQRTVVSVSDVTSSDTGSISF